MKVAFAGTPEFAQVALARLHDAGFEIPLVLTQPDRPAGRGMKLQASPVKAFAVERGITVAQPRSLRSIAAAGSVQSTSASAFSILCA
jgi:methionyl-tRNA formyltransferase